MEHPPVYQLKKQNQHFIIVKCKRRVDEAHPKDDWLQMLVDACDEGYLKMMAISRSHACQSIEYIDADTFSIHHIHVPHLFGYNDNCLIHTIISVSANFLPIDWLSDPNSTFQQITNLFA